MTEDTRPVMVTVQTTVYNHEPYLRQCLDGIITQLTNFHFEVVVHDDASTDGSAAIIKEYAARYPNLIIPVFENENLYSKHDGSLRKTMQKHSRGRYIAICEGDDYWINPRKLQMQFDYMEAHPGVSMCGTNSLVLYEDFDSAPVYFSPWTKEEIIKPEVFDFNLVFHASTYFYKREIFQICDDFNFEAYTWDSSIRLLAMYAGEIATLGLVTSVFRIDNGRASSFTQVTLKSKDSELWVIDESEKLEKHFDSFSKGKFSDICNAKLQLLEIRKDTYVWRKRIGILALLIIHPSYNIPKTFHNIIDRLSIRNRHNYFFRKRKHNIKINIDSSFKTK